MRSSLKKETIKKRALRGEPLKAFNMNVDSSQRKRQGSNNMKPNTLLICKATKDYLNTVLKKRIEHLDHYNRSNQDTCLVHKPAVTIGEWVQSGDLLADSSASMNGELAIGKNILVAYMPWEGYNYEDAILINERLVYDDVYTSIHIERYEIETKEGQLGSDQITREIPDIAPEAIAHLDSTGIAKVGSWIEEGDILVGKVTPINKKSQTPYQKLLFKLLDKTLNSVRDSSLRAPKGIKANVINVHILAGVKEFQKKLTSDRNKIRSKKSGGAVEDQTSSKKTSQAKKGNSSQVLTGHFNRPSTYGFSKVQNNSLTGAEGLNQEKLNIRSSELQKWLSGSMPKEKMLLQNNINLSNSGLTAQQTKTNQLSTKYKSAGVQQKQKPASYVNTAYTAYTAYTGLKNRKTLQNKTTRINSASILKADSISKPKLTGSALLKQHRNFVATQDQIVKFTPTLVHIYLAEKRKIQVGDKMAGRHGNKGIISNILPREDMPFLPDGTPIDIVLNPLGVPSRMNVGQIYECLLGLAGKYLGEHFKIFPFDEIYGPEASRSFVFAKLFEARKKTGIEWLFDPNSPGKIRIFDGRTCEGFDQPVTVGIAYMLKLVHMVDDKIHARSTGPYSLVTQQPLRGRAKQGGQRLGEMEVWAIEGYGAAFVLLEMLTLKSDDMTGRLTLWSNLILNKEITIGTPESFKVLVCELQALCLDIGLFHFNKISTTESTSVGITNGSDAEQEFSFNNSQASTLRTTLKQAGVTQSLPNTSQSKSESLVLQEISHLMLLP